MKKLAALGMAFCATALGFGQPARANAQIPSQLLGEWRASFDIIDFRSDGSFLRSTHRSDLFASCGPVFTVASVGTFALNGNQITVFPKDGFLDTQNTCTGAHSRSRYINPPGRYFIQLGDGGRTLYIDRTDRESKCD